MQLHLAVHVASIELLTGNRAVDRHEHEVAVAAAAVTELQICDVSRQEMFTGSCHLTRYVQPLRAAPEDPEADCTH